MTLLLSTFFFIWELPQNLSGLITYLLVRKQFSAKEKRQMRRFYQVPGFSATLGSYVFWSASTPMNGSASPTVKHHEFGHSVQSRILGPFFLIVVGIPSVSRNLYGRYYYKKHKKLWGNYFSGYPEKWADNLGLRFYKD